MSKKDRVNKSNFAAGYTGDLATPIEPDVVGSLRRSESESEFTRGLTKRVGLKFKELFDWYGIDPNGPDAGMHLALKLAVAHVPGMQFSRRPRNRGRKRTWKAGLGKELQRDVAALQQAKKLNNKQAIAELHKEKRWRVYSIANLITRHREARNDRRHSTEFLPLSKLRELFEVVKTDENSSDQN
jgi:hypothetical protein